MIKIVSIVAALCVALTPSTTVVLGQAPNVMPKVEYEVEPPVHVFVDNIELQITSTPEELELESEKRNEWEVEEREVERLRSEKIIDDQMRLEDEAELTKDISETDISEPEGDTELNDMDEKVEVDEKVEEDIPNVEPKPPKQEDKQEKETEEPKISAVHGYTKEEIKILQRITEAEATGAGIEAKKNVVSVILNRVRSDRFPDTIESVVFQKSQFSPIGDGRYYSVNITEETIQAVDSVLDNGVTNNALFFCNYKDVESLSTQEWFNNLTYLFKDNSGHSFYR